LISESSIVSIDAVTSQPPHFAKPQSAGSSKEASEPKSAEAGETSAQETTEGSSIKKASPPPGTALVFDKLA